MKQYSFSQLQKFAEMFSGKLSILEEEVDIDTQKEYYKMSKEIKRAKEDYTVSDLLSLKDESLSDDDKKEILIKLALLDDPKAYTIIDEYNKTAPETLKNWSLMALQESRMVMESMFVDDNQVFISTGLGGKGKMLRYFVALIANGIDSYEDFHKKIIQSEFEFVLKNNQSELESIEFENRYTLITVLIPFTISFSQVIKTALDECNQYGNFLENNFLITNVSRLTPNDLDKMLEEKKLPNIDSLDSFDDIEQED